MVQFADFTLEEHRGPIRRILDRANELKITANRSRLAMDIAAVHYHTPLNIEQLANDFSIGDFGHDIRGIQANIDRATGKLLNCFLPRCSQ